MTIAEAIWKKSNYPKTYIKREIKFHVIISPSIQEDFNSMYYSEDVGSIYSNSEKIAPKYSSNNDYLVMGMNWDGANIIWDQDLKDVGEGRS